MLSLKQVSYYSGSSCLLDDISAEFKAGQLSVIIGPNGAGKSSLLKLACGELEAQAGQVQYLGQALAEHSLANLALQRAVLNQHNPLEFNFTVAEVVALARMPHASGAAYDAQVVDECLVLLDLCALRTAYYPSLSGGEKQRVQIARVLAQLHTLDEQALSVNEPRLLILDEPIAALDLYHQQQLLVLLQNKARLGYCVVLVLHDLNLGIQFADQILLLNHARLVAKGPVSQVMQAELLAQVFGLPFYPLQHPKTGQLLFSN